MSDMTPTEQRIWEYLKKTLSGSDFTPCNQTKIGRELGLAGGTVTRIMRRLVDLQLLIRVPTNDKIGSYMLNPNITKKEQGNG